MVSRPIDPCSSRRSLIQEHMGLFEDHGPPELDGVLSQQAIAPRENGAPKDP